MRAALALPMGFVLASSLSLPACGTDEAPASVADVVASGVPTARTEARPAYGALVAAQDGSRTYVVESRRDIEPGPYGIPWRSRFRLAAYDAAGDELWAHEAEQDDLIADVAVHPSGELTFALERFTATRRAYELVRLDRQGRVVGRTVLEEPTTLPASDFGPGDPRPLFRMKSDFADALTAGWVRLLPDGEGLVVAFTSYVDVPENDPRVRRRATGLAKYAFRDAVYVETWARVVEGVHTAEPAAWAYDELRWREQAVRPFLARDESTGDLLVGRAWNETRCEANVATFAEVGATDCVLGSVGILENERLPLAVTRFDAEGKRIGTVVLAPDADAAEQVPFALAAHEGRLAVVGSIVREGPDGTRRTYDGSLVDYDGYVAVYDADGMRVEGHDFDGGRGDALVAMRFTRSGIVAVGAAGWDRGTGGMSIFRGADPLIVHYAVGGTEHAIRIVPLGDETRHWNLHDVLVVDGAILGFGLSDAPLTHSADQGNDAARTHGPLRLRLALAP